MLNKSVVSGYLIITFVQIMLGINIPITRDLLTNYLSPLAYMAIRAVAAALVFWVVQCFLTRERIERHDFVMIIIGGLLGFVLSQYLTALSLQYTTPVYFSMILALSPMFVMLMQAIWQHERITRRKGFGVFLGIAGAGILALRAAFEESGSGSNNLLGISLAVLSVGSFAAYVVICGDICRKYQPITQMKWIFTTSALITTPVLISTGMWQHEQILSAGDLHVPLIEIAFLIVFCTIGAYTLIPVGMRLVGPQVVSILMNLQPIAASAAAILIGMDVFTWDKPLALCLVLIGAYIVSSRHARRGPVKEHTEPKTAAKDTGAATSSTNSSGPAQHAA